MTKTRVPSKDLGKIRLQDRTNWKRVIEEPQATVERNLGKEKDNPVLSNVRFHRLKDAKR